MVGARSALILTFPDLGLIVVDEEHDQAYKQEEGVPYQARDMAVVRGQVAGYPGGAVVGDAVPRNLCQCGRGRYRRLGLPRYGGQRMPSVAAIDLRQSAAAPPRHGAAVPSAVQTRRAWRAGVVLSEPPRLRATDLVPRLRFASPVRTATPGWSITVSAAARLPPLRLRHAASGQLPALPGGEFVAAVGPGVERLEEEVRELFPGARILVLSSDLVATVERLREELDDVAQGKFDIVIGTQLVAKGHHFPKLNLVGVIDADLGLSNGDPRAAERTFQLLHQVVGRAGRDAGIGRGYLQTHQPEHPVMRALIAQDRDAFYAAEIEMREKAHYPPFGRLASLVVAGTISTRPRLRARARPHRAASVET